MVCWKWERFDTLNVLVVPALSQTSLALIHRHHSPLLQRKQHTIHPDPYISDSQAISKPNLNTVFLSNELIKTWGFERLWPCLICYCLSSCLPNFTRIQSILFRSFLTLWIKDYKHMQSMHNIPLPEALHDFHITINIYQDHLLLFSMLFLACPFQNVYCINQVQYLQPQTSLRVCFHHGTISFTYNTVLRNIFLFPTAFSDIRAPLMYEDNTFSNHYQKPAA